MWGKGSCESSPVTCALFILARYGVSPILNCAWFLKAHKTAPRDQAGDPSAGPGGLTEPPEPGKMTTINRLAGGFLSGPGMAEIMATTMQPAN